MTEPQTEYVPVNASGPGWTSRANAFIARHNKPHDVNVPRQVPRFLANRSTIIYAWLLSMAIICWDEWHNGHILPRPSRLWYATWFFLLLVFGGMIDLLVPLMNALAIGYAIMLAWQLFTGQGVSGTPAVAATGKGASGP